MLLRTTLIVAIALVGRSSAKSTRLCWANRKWRKDQTCWSLWQSESNSRWRVWMSLRITRECATWSLFQARKIFTLKTILSEFTAPLMFFMSLKLANLDMSSGRLPMKEPLDGSCNKCEDHFSAKLRFSFHAKLRFSFHVDQGHIHNLFIFVQ